MSAINMLAVVRRMKHVNADINDWEIARHINDTPAINSDREYLERIAAHFAAFIDGDDYEYRVVEVTVTLNG